MIAAACGGSRAVSERTSKNTLAGLAPAITPADASGGMPDGEIAGILLAAQRGELAELTVGVREVANPSVQAYAHEVLPDIERTLADEMSMLYQRSFEPIPTPQGGALSAEADSAVCTFAATPQYELDWPFLLAQDALLAHAQAVLGGTAPVNDPRLAAALRASLARFAAWDDEVLGLEQEISTSGTPAGGYDPATAPGGEPSSQ
jgi:hypothetical protein